MQQADPSGNVCRPLIYGDSHPLDDLHSFFYVHPGGDLSERERELVNREGSEIVVRSPPPHPPPNLLLCFVSLQPLKDVLSEPPDNSLSWMTTDTQTYTNINSSNTFNWAANPTPTGFHQIPFILQICCFKSKISEEHLLSRAMVRS